MPAVESSETSDQKQVLEVDYNHEGQSPISIVSDPDANTFGCP